MTQPTFLLVDPAHFDVAYAINPWMAPQAWAQDRARHLAAARRGSRELIAALRGRGARVEIVSGVAGAPDLVFPANAAVVLDGRAVLARFLCPERQVEEPIFRRTFEDLRRRGVIEEVLELPDGVVQEGAGDAIWDVRRGLFWTGYGQRSDAAGIEAVATAFGRAHVPLELATARFYHLDTCFCPLPGGEVLYYPPAFTPQAQARIAAHVAPSDRIEAAPEDAAAFCVNAVAFGRTIVMARAPEALRCRLEERGYEILEIDLTPFIMSGGGAYCMTLRLDRSSRDDDALVAEAAE